MRPEPPPSRSGPPTSRPHEQLLLSCIVGTATEFVRAGMDVAIGYAELFEGFDVDGFVCIPLDPPVYDRRGLMWRKDRILTPAAQAFLRQLESLVATWPETEAEGQAELRRA